MILKEKGNGTQYMKLDQIDIAKKASKVKDFFKLNIWLYLNSFWVNKIDYFENKSKI